MAPVPAADIFRPLPRVIWPAEAPGESVPPSLTVTVMTVEPLTLAAGVRVRTPVELGVL